MEEVVAVAVETTNGPCYFMTWGRIQHAVDAEPVEAIVLAAAVGFATPGTPVSARLCDSLQEVAQTPLFHELFFGFCNRPIPDGRRYEQWRKRMDARMRSGREISYLGPWGRS